MKVLANFRNPLIWICSFGGVLIAFGVSEINHLMWLLLNVPNTWVYPVLHYTVGGTLSVGLVLLWFSIAPGFWRELGLTGTVRSQPSTVSNLLISLGVLVIVLVLILVGLTLSVMFVPPTHLLERAASYGTEWFWPIFSLLVGFGAIGIGLRMKSKPQDSNPVS